MIAFDARPGQVIKGEVHCIIDAIAPGHFQGLWTTDRSNSDGRRSSHNAKSRQGHILDMVSIRERPAEIEDRAVP